MRLWHSELIPYLPRTQLLAQWRELNSIFVNQPNHILINYVYNDKIAFYNYSVKVIEEMVYRKYKLSDKAVNNWYNYFKDTPTDRIGNHMFKEHDYRYLNICYFNLLEKYIRGQKDFTEKQMIDITNCLIYDKKGTDFNIRVGELND